MLNDKYIDSDKAQELCLLAIEHIEDKPSEHDFYLAGQKYFQSKVSEQNSDKLRLLLKLFGADWQKIRFNNVVRLGGDIEATGLSGYNKATIIGVFLYLSKNQ